MPSEPKGRLSPANRKRRDRCKEFLRRAGSVPGAKRLADEEHFAVNTSVWIGALGEMLTEALNDR